EGVVMTGMPSDLAFRTEIAPVYEVLPGWDTDISEVRTLEDLPCNARAYVRRVEELIGVPVASLSVGPAREQTILLRDPR
ncbi:MAG: adenylosuccinate synthetase, partial [Chthonomonadaceae bacterium]|nr:adenylosuccinate synthetase [Chthonomonadaceae bacterium]